MDFTVMHADMRISAVLRKCSVTVRGFEGEEADSTC